MRGGVYLSLACRGGGRGPGKWELWAGGEPSPRELEGC